MTRNIINLLSLFDIYQRTFGYIIRKKKCNFFHGAIQHKHFSSISFLLGFKIGSLPFNYHDVPFLKGKPKKLFFQPFVDKTRNKLGVWKGDLLSLMGRVQLVKSVINGKLDILFPHLLASLLKLLYTLSITK